MSRPPLKRTESGKIKAIAVEAMRAKMDSIMENTIPLLDEATQALENAISSAPPTTERPASPFPPSQSVPIFVEEPIPEPPDTLPSPSNLSKRIEPEPDPFAERTRRWKETLRGVTDIDEGDDHD